MPSTLDHQAQLRAAGLRTTKQRLAVLNVVSHQPHADTATILDGVRRDLPTVSHQTVYDALHDLTAAGLLRRFRLSSAGAPLPRADKGRAGLGVLPPVGDYPIHTS